MINVEKECKREIKVRIKQFWQKEEKNGKENNEAIKEGGEHVFLT